MEEKAGAGRKPEGVDRGGRRGPGCPLRDEYRVLFDEAPLGWHLLDKDGIVVDVSRAWLEMTGYSYDESIGLPLDRFLSPRYSKAVQKAFSALKKSTEAHTMEYELLRKDGSVLAISADCRTMRIDGGPERTQCMLHDITERKREQVEREKLDSELRKALARGEEGLALICGFCNRILSHCGTWEDLEDFLSKRIEFARVVCPECERKLYPQTGEERKTITMLSEREKEVLDYIRSGRRTQDISSLLGITESTVKYHVGRIMGKLNATSRTHAVAIAVEAGIIGNSREEGTRGPGARNRLERWTARKDS